VKQAKVDLFGYTPKKRDLQGHMGRHTNTYHDQVKQRLDDAYDEVAGKGKHAAQEALHSVIGGIWRDIANGTLRPYANHDVTLPP
jgi:hypothetical protein